MAVLVEILRLFIHVPAIVVAFTLHGYARAVASSALGDKYPKSHGRITLNPLRHFEPVGFLMLLFFGLGWGKPVETRPFAYKNRKTGALIVAILPLTVNLLLAAIFASIAHVMAATIAYPLMSGLSWQRFVYEIIVAGAFYNLSFALFNLIPIYPLDGARILAVAKPRWSERIVYNERIAQTVLMLLLFFGVLNMIINPMSAGILGFLYV